ncbi:MAG: TPM domain-containing protein [Clostridiales bacterium]|nr:TPM domain-containing protein [Clostridiales bacterium]
MRHMNLIRILTCLFTVLLLHPIFLHAEVTGQRVYDEADILSEEEEIRLEQLCKSYADETHMDFVILTTDDAQSKTSEAFADDFYDEGGFGYDKPQGNGVLFLIDMDNREICISTCGDAIYYMTDKRIDEVLEAVYESVSVGDYGGGCKTFLQKTAAFLKSDPYARPTLKQRMLASLKRSPIYIAIAAVVACVYGGSLKRSRAYRNTTNFTTYQDRGNFHLVQREDFFLRETTTTRRIVTDTGRGSGGGHSGGSSTHVSSGGVTHGGGSMKF